MPSFNEHSFFVIAHRGAKAYAPENTVSAIEKALELGARHIEIDVRAVDSEIYLSHDQVPELKTAAGRAIKMIPTLRQVLSIVKGRAALNIELKEDVITLLIPLLKEYFSTEPSDSILISSFNKQLLEKIKIELPNCLIAPLYDEKIPEVVPDWAFSINLSRELIKNKLSLALPVFSYTVNSKAEAERLRKLGVSAIFSDYPDLMGTPLT